MFLLRRVISCRTNLLSSVFRQRNVALKRLRPILGGSTQYGRSWEPIVSGNKEIAFQQFIVAVQPMTCITCSCLASLLSLLVVAAPAHITCGCLRSSLVIANWRLSGWPIRQVSEKDSELFNKNGPTKRTQFLRYQPPMDTKFGTIYCAISDVGYCFIFATPTPSKLYRS